MLKPFRVELRDANDFVAKLHRHHAPCTGHRFSLGVQTEAGLCGVAICGRPVGRMIPQSEVLEVNRCCTDGTRNACSWLYTAAARCAREMGFRAVITYTNVNEDGASLRACGWWFFARATALTPERWATTWAASPKPCIELVFRR